MSLKVQKKDVVKPKLTDRERFPEMFAPNRNIDRRQCTRVVPMRVLVLGMCRTGTASMWEALKMLGFRDCYHMFNLMIDPRDNEMWIDAIDGKYFGGKPFTKTEWDQLLGHCQAVCDFPACAFAEELITAYPDAKVILTNRPVEAWYTSCIGTIRQSMTSPLLYFIGHFDTEVMGKWTVMTRKLFNGFFDYDFEKNGRQVFEQQYSRVRELVPKDRLLEFELGDGWEKLCPFLEVDIPEVGYPRVNEATAFKDRNALRFRLAVQRGMPRIVASVTALAGVVTAAAWYWLR